MNNKDKNGYMINPADYIKSNKMIEVNPRDVLKIKPPQRIMPDFSCFMESKSESIGEKDKQATSDSSASTVDKDGSEETTDDINKRLLAEQKKLAKQRAELERQQYTTIKNVEDICKLYFKEETIECNTRWAVDAVGDTFTKWNREEPALLDFPTGAGKTTLIYKKLIPDAIKDGHNVLLVSNRIALNAQQKKKILKIVRELKPESVEHIKDEDLDIGKNKGKRKKKDKDISKDLSIIGPVCVITYQSLSSFFNPPEAKLPFYTSKATKLLLWSQQLKYAVFDEIHFLYSDAEFNGFCGYLLNYIPYVFCNVIRVYMTATSWEIKDYLIKYEKNKLSRNFRYPPKAQFMDESYIRDFTCRKEQDGEGELPRRKLYHYTMPRDYSRYNLNFLNTPSALAIDPEDEINKIDAVVNAMHPKPCKDNKWIVNVDDKFIGTLLKKELKKHGINAAYIDKDRCEPKNVRETIINKEKFNQSVLITTPVIDCGVNICDEAVKNIVIFYTDRTQFIQALGRKRLKDGETGINIWVWIPKDKSLARRISIYQSNLSLCSRTLYANEVIKNEYNSIFNNRIEYAILNRAKEILTDADFDLFNEYLHSKNFKSALSIMERIGQSPYAIVAKEIWQNRDKLNNDALIRIDNNGLFTANIYTMAVMLRKMKLLQKILFRDEDEDYRDIVSEWLDMGDYVEDEENTMLQDLDNLLYDNLNISIPAEEFTAIRAEIVKVHVMFFGLTRSKERMKNLNANSLNSMLTELHLEYKVSVVNKIWSISNCI